MAWARSNIQPAPSPGLTFGHCGDTLRHPIQICSTSPMSTPTCSATTSKGIDHETTRHYFDQFHNQREAEVTASFKDAINGCAVILGRGDQQRAFLSLDALQRN